MSAFIAEKGEPGLTVSRDIDKLGYKSLETCELLFENFRVPAENLIGGREGEGFKHVMTGLESERINVAARGLGIARASFEEAIKYSQDPTKASRHGYKDRSLAIARLRSGREEGPRRALRPRSRNGQAVRNRDGSGVLA